MPGTPRQVFFDNLVSGAAAHLPLAPGIKVPTTVIAAEHDRVIPPAHTDALIERFAPGVVRVVIIGEEGGESVPVSHGTGFAVSPTRIVTNAHVVSEAAQDDTLRIGIVPPEGAGGAFARVVAISPRNDLALLEIAPNSLRLPPLALAGGAGGNLGEVAAVGYPMNVDLAQGLDMADIFRAQPPVKSRGFLSGERPSRQFDTILHTAPIARGNSGGPLLDPCGRVIGVNSFSSDSASGDAEFYFAVSLRELFPFLRNNGVEPVTNALPCRSIDELNAEGRERLVAASDRYAAMIGRKVTRVTLRDTRSRWGSCAHDGALMYSWRLIMAPPTVLDYVAAHEVAHLVGRGMEGHRQQAADLLRRPRDFRHDARCG